MKSCCVAYRYRYQCAVLKGGTLYPRHASPEAKHHTTIFNLHFAKSQGKVGASRPTETENGAFYCAHLSYAHLQT